MRWELTGTVAPTRRDETREVSYCDVSSAALFGERKGDSSPRPYGYPYRDLPASSADRTSKHALCQRNSQGHSASPRDVFAVFRILMGHPSRREAMKRSAHHAAQLPMVLSKSSRQDEMSRLSGNTGRLVRCSRHALASFFSYHLAISPRWRSRDRANDGSREPEEP